MQAITVKSEEYTFISHGFRILLKSNYGKEEQENFMEKKGISKNTSD